MRQTSLETDCVLGVRSDVDDVDAGVEHLPRSDHTSTVVGFVELELLDVLRQL